MDNSEIKEELELLKYIADQCIGHVNDSDRWCSDDDDRRKKRFALVSLSSGLNSIEQLTRKLKDMI